MRNSKIMLFNIIVLFVGCTNNEIAVPEVCDLRPSYVTLREYKNAEGIVRKFNFNPERDPDSYYIEVTNCDDCPYVRDIPSGLTNLGLLPCNLPTNLRKDSLSVSFSGSAKIDTVAAYGAIDINGIPFEISKIERKSPEQKTE